ncbi:MAG: hypothetical protein WCZ08_00660 [Parcubacteria group bacterium]
MPEKTPSLKMDFKKKEGEKLPYTQMYPIVDLYRDSPDKSKFMAAMKKNGINVNGENITPVDFFATSRDMSDEEILEAVEAYLGINNIEEKFELINKSLESAKDYIENYLHLGLPKEIKKIDEIKSKKEVLDIFKKTAALKKGEGLKLSPSYCVLVSVFAATFEFRKEELEGLIKESEYIYEKMFEMEKKSGIANFCKLEYKEGEYDKIIVYDEEREAQTSAESYFRGKSEYSFVSKMLNKPESNAKEASIDGIGLKLELDSKDEIEKLIPFLSRYLEKKFDARDIIFENTRLFSEGDAIYQKIGTVKENKNPYSNKNFKSFKINGKLNVPKNGDANGMIISRQFEIQIVLASNKNESGFSDHNIYEASKKIAIVTRLLGSVTDNYLKIVSAEASRKSGVSAKKIEKYLKETFLLEARSKSSNKKRYAHKSHTERRKRAGIIPNDIIIRKIKK